MKLYHFSLPFLLLLLISCNNPNQNSETGADTSEVDTIAYNLVEDDRYNKAQSVLISFTENEAPDFFDIKDTQKDSLVVLKTDSIIKINYYKMLGGSPVLRGDCKLKNDSLQVTYWYELNPAQDMVSVMSPYKLTYKIIPTSFKGIKVTQLDHYYIKPNSK